MLTHDRSLLTRIVGFYRLESTVSAFAPSQCLLQLFS